MGRNYRNIKAWQLADVLAVSVYRSTANFPKSELYGLTSQLRRAAVSVAANIAEGANRGHKREYLRFLHIAKGSLAEVEYLLHLASELDFFLDDCFSRLNGVCDECSRTLLGLIRSVEREVAGICTEG